MLTRRAKAYSSSCSQIALVYLQPFQACVVSLPLFCGDYESGVFRVASDAVPHSTFT